MSLTVTALALVLLKTGNAANKLEKIEEVEVPRCVKRVGPIDNSATNATSIEVTPINFSSFLLSAKQENAALAMDLELDSIAKLAEARLVAQLEYDREDRLWERE